MTPEELQEFENRFNQASSLVEKREIAGDFINAKFPNGKSNDILVKLCVELDELNNYFTKYVDLYTNGANITPSRGLMVALNNLYANNVIDDHDLEGTGNEDRDSILFKSDLSDNKSSSDIEFLIKSYMWLTSESNISRMDFNSLLDFVNNESVNDAQDYKNISNVCSQLLNPTETTKPTSQDVRNAILFKDENNSKLRDKKEVENLLHAASSRVSAKSRNNRVSKTLSDISKMNDEEKQELFQALELKLNQ